MLIIEGIDGVGKTTLVEHLQSCGMKKYHFDYDSKNMDLFSNMIQRKHYKQDNKKRLKYTRKKREETLFWHQNSAKSSFPPR